MASRTMIAVGSLAALVFVAPAARATFPSCIYDATGEGTVQAFLNDDQFGRLFVDEGDEIKAKFDPEEVDCQDATTANTRNVFITGSSGNDLILISQNGAGGRFPTDIFFSVNGMEGANEIRLTGSLGPDSFRFGVDPADAGAAPAADLYGNGDAFIRLFNIQSASAHMLAGNDHVTANPGAGFDGALTIPLTVEAQRGADEIIGSGERNEFDGGAGGDLLKGRAGRDFLFGRVGNDVLNGGPDHDRCAGGPGNDVRRNCES